MPYSVITTVKWATPAGMGTRFEMNTQLAQRWIKSGVSALSMTHMVIVCLFALIYSLFFVSTETWAEEKKLNIVAFGDSLTAGYGLPAGADFATRLQAALDDRGHQVVVTNAGVSGDTTTGGLARFEWAVPAGTDAVILELGANDALRGIAPKIARANLDQILQRLAARKIDVLIAGMRAPANWGDAYAAEFDAMYAALANEYGALLYPFFLEGVIERRELKLADGLHPSAKGVEEIVRRILPSVEKLIKRASEG
jgi:acyl-CoA thioesterase-1